MINAFVLYDKPWAATLKPKTKYGTSVLNILVMFFRQFHFNFTRDTLKRIKIIMNQI